MFLGVKKNTQMSSFKKLGGGHGIDFVPQFKKEKRNKNG